jgi:hypothetical protein
MGKDRPEANGADGAGRYKPVLHPTDKDPSVGTPVLGLSGEPGEQVVRRGGPGRYSTNRSRRS